MKPLPFRIKICGITTSEDASDACAAGAGAIGLNFYPHSKRFITHDEAAKTKFTLHNSAAFVGVFVNPTVHDIAYARSFAAFDWIQLHGVEPPKFIAEVKSAFGFPVLRAFRWGLDGSQPIDEYLKDCSSLGCMPDAVLIDSFKPGEYGGTGETADWQAVGQWRRAIDLPIVLAGGLTHCNVARAIDMVRPDAVDTASGVEVSAGRKDSGLIRKFIAASNQAFSALSE